MAYKVGDSVTSHEAWGVGSYCSFGTNASVVLGDSFEVPNNGGVRFHDLVTVSLGGTGTISHVINNTGAALSSGHQVTDLVSFSWLGGEWGRAPAAGHRRATGCFPGPVSAGVVGVARGEHVGHV